MASKHKLKETYVLLNKIKIHQKFPEKIRKFSLIAGLKWNQSMVQFTPVVWSNGHPMEKRYTAKIKTKLT